MAEARTYRLSETTQKRIEELSLEIGGSKDRVFNALMDTYMLQREAVSAAEDDRDKIEKFQQYAQCLVEYYADALKSAKTAQDRVRTEFHSQLQTQADAVADYKARTEKAEKAAAEAVQKTEKCEDSRKREKEAFQIQMDKLKAELTIAEEKAVTAEKVCSGYKAQVAALEMTATECDWYKEKARSLEKKMEEMSAQISALGQNSRDAEKEYREKMESYKEDVKAQAMQTQEKFEAKLEQIRAEHASKENILHADKENLYKTILEMQKQSDKEIREKDAEIAALKAQLLAQKSISQTVTE